MLSMPVGDGPSHPECMGESLKLNQVAHLWIFESGLKKLSELTYNWSELPNSVWTTAVESRKTQCFIKEKKFASFSTF